MMAAPRQQGDRRLADLLYGFAELAQGADVALTGLSQDSREVRRGDVFFAVQGTRGHGLQHLDQALAAGAAAVVWEPVPGQELASWLQRPDGARVPAVAVEQLSRRLGDIADRYFGQPSRHLFVVGVTGTDGKTSCSQFLAQCLDEPGRRCGVIGTLGYGLPGALETPSHTTPDAIRLHGTLADLVAAGARAVVMEVSSHALDQGRVTGVAFDVAVLTNLGREHLDYHGSLEHYQASKARLFHMPGLRNAVINLDDPWGAQLWHSLPDSVQCLGYGLQPLLDAEPRLRAERLRLHADGYAVDVQSPWGKAHLQGRLLGRFNVSNALAVLSVLLLAERPMTEAAQCVARLRTVAGRMESFGGDHQPLVIVDYAHTPQALRQVLEALRPHTRERLWCVFGCGGDRDRGKRPQMAAAAEAIADHVIITDDNPRHESPDRIIADIMAGLRQPGDVQVVRDRGEAIATAIQRAAPGDTVLIAGKGHEQEQWLGDRRIPFSDRAQVRAVLAARS